jgi:hypothetical protein
MPNQRPRQDELFGAAEFAPIQDNHELGPGIRDGLKTLRASEATLKKEIRPGLGPVNAETP